MLEMGVMPEIAQAIEEMDWRFVHFLFLCLFLIVSLLAVD